MIDWIKPNRTLITTNDMKATLAYADKLGWKRVKQPKKAKSNGNSSSSDKGFFTKNISAGFGG